MPLANSHGPRWIRSHKVTTERRLRGIAPIREFLARLFGRRPVPPGAASSTRERGDS